MRLVFVIINCDNQLGAYYQNLYFNVVSCTHSAAKNYPNEDESADLRTD